jgi:hypothetical protein
MFAVYQYPRTMARGEDPICQWAGLPSIDEVLEAVGIRNVGGIVLEVGTVRLPAHRINTYSEPGTRGSYDGWAVRVSRLIDTSPQQPMGDTLRTACESVFGLYFRIAHGLAKGIHPINDDPGYYRHG